MGSDNLSWPLGKSEVFSTTCGARDSECFGGSGSSSTSESSGDAESEEMLGWVPRRIISTMRLARSSLLMSPAPLNTSRVGLGWRTRCREIRALSLRAKAFLRLSTSTLE